MEPKDSTRSSYQLAKEAEAHGQLPQGLHQLLEMVGPRTAVTRQTQGHHISRVIQSAPGWGHSLTWGTLAPLLSTLITSIIHRPRIIHREGNKFRGL